MHIGGDISIDVPEPLVKSSDLPLSQLKLKFSLDARSDQVPTDFSRSKYHATLRVIITDLKGERSYLDFNTNVDGEGNGTPDEELWSIFGRLNRSAEVVGSALEKTSSTKPAAH